MRLAVPKPLLGLSAAIALAGFMVPVGAGASATPVPHRADGAPAGGAAGCPLPSKLGVRHVVYLQFDNVHLRRDNPNVPSDLEQMPTLMRFLENNGVLSNNHHTPLIGHTADDIITTMTGLYGDQQGMPVANDYRYFAPSGFPLKTYSWGYWTDRVGSRYSPSPADPNYNLLTATGKNAPAPWAAFTKAGCNVGSIGTANTDLENNTGDIATVYHPGNDAAPGVNEQATAETATNQGYTDYVGLAIHCALNSATCGRSRGGVLDSLPDEPGGYHDFRGLFGAKYVMPAIGESPMRDLNGHVIMNSYSHTPGFPGFDGMTASVTLAYVAQMLEHNVPVTFGYLSSVHVNPHNGYADAGPGNAGYEQVLHQYDRAFGQFFARLQRDGINKSNTLFVITSDENDQFVGSAPTPAGCDGVTVPCHYRSIGEIQVYIQRLMHEHGNTTPFQTHNDSAAGFYLTGRPSRSAPVTRNFERTLGALVVRNPLTGQRETLINYLADPVELAALHMVTGDPQRTPTLIGFAKPYYWLQDYPPTCNAKLVISECGNPANGNDAWMHGTVSPQINRTWLGLVGPGVRQVGLTNAVWSDHTDVRPTILVLTGLRDPYEHEGRALIEFMDEKALPPSLVEHRGVLIRLGEQLKVINAPVGDFGIQTLTASSNALRSGAASDDSRYQSIENRIASLTARRDQLSREVIGAWEAASFADQPISAKTAQDWLRAMEQLDAQARQLAAAS